MSHLIVVILKKKPYEAVCTNFVFIADIAMSHFVFLACTEHSQLGSMQTFAGRS